MARKRVAQKAKRTAASTDSPKPPSHSKPGGLAPSLLPFVLAAVALCALILIAYGDSVDNGFVWDDHEQIVMNPYIKPGAPLTPLFAGDVRFAHQGPTEQTRVYRPLQLLTYRVVAGGVGSTPEAFHAVSLIFAMVGALAAFAVFWLLTRKIGMAFAAAALFAVHPVHTEAVDWIAALPDLGVGLFTLLAFALFLAGRNTSGEQEPAGRWLFPSLSLCAFFVALLWKETAVVFPLLVIAYGAVVEKTRVEQGDVNWRQGTSRGLKASAPYWIVLAAYLALRFAVLGGLTAGARTWNLNPGQFVLTVFHLTMLYWGKLLLPLGLNAYHVLHPLRSLADPRAVVTLLVGFGAAAGIVYLLRRAPLAAFAALWVLVTLLPAWNLNGLGRNPFAERYLYLPSAGFCLLAASTAAWLLQRVPGTYRKPAGIVLLTVVLAGYTTEAIARNPDWKDDNTLFGETLKLSPDAPFVRVMVASEQSEDPAESAAAEQNYLQTIALAQRQSPPDRLDTVIAYQGLASIYADRRQFDPALGALAQAEKIAPGDPDTAGQEGMILARAGRGSQAETLLDRALSAQPGNENVLSALGLIARDEHHDLKRAAELFSRALAAHPQEDDFSASLHNNLGAVYADQENYGGAVVQLQEAVAIQPINPDYHVNLASALAGAGRFDDARSEAEKALQIAPDDGSAREILERLRQQK